MLGLVAVLIFCSWIVPLPPSVGSLEQSLSHSVLFLVFAWLVSSVNLFICDELTVDGYFRGLAPLLGVMTFRVGQQFRTVRSAFILLSAVTMAGLLSALNGSFDAIRYGLIDPNDFSSSIHFRSLLDSKFFDALVLSLPIALIGGGLIGTVSTKGPLLGLGAILFLFSLLTLMRSGIVIAACVLLFEMAIIFRTRLLWTRFWRRVPLIILLVGLLEVASCMSILAGLRVPSVFRAVGAIGGRHQLISDQMDDGVGAYRLVEAVAAWERFSESPVIGHGLGSTVSVIFDGTTEVDRYSMRYTHNFFTYILYTCGLIGITAAARFFLVAFRLMIRAGGLASTSPEPGIDMALVLLVLAMLIYIQFQSIFRSATYFMMLGLVLGCLAARVSHLSKSMATRQGGQVHA